MSGDLGNFRGFLVSFCIIAEICKNNMFSAKKRVNIKETVIEKFPKLETIAISEL